MKQRNQFIEGDIRLVSLDNMLTWKARCPDCKKWSYLDDDQFHGKIAMICENCGMFTRKDLSAIYWPVKEDARLQ